MFVAGGVSLPCAKGGGRAQRGRRDCSAGHNGAPMSLADPCFNNHHPITLAIITMRCSDPSVSSQQASYPSPLSKAHRIAHSAAVPLKIKAFALILLRRIDFRRQPCEAPASQGDLRKSIGRAPAPFAQGSLWVKRIRRRLAVESGAFCAGRRGRRPLRGGDGLPQRRARRFAMTWWGTWCVCAEDWRSNRVRSARDVEDAVPYEEPSESGCRAGCLRPPYGKMRSNCEFAEIRRSFQLDLHGRMISAPTVGAG